MANNRIYLRCRGCGECLFLGKSNLGGFWYDTVGMDLPPLERRLNDFYADHNYCGRERTAYTPYDTEAFPMPDDCAGCDGSFDIVYEDPLPVGY